MFKFPWFILCVLFLVGCGPTLRSTLDVPVITGPFGPAELGSSQSAARARTYVYLDNFIDTRMNPAIAVEEGREVAGQGEITSVVIEGLQKGLSSLGFQFSETAPVILAGEVREWVAQVKSSGLMSRSDATAVLYVEVLDPANKRVYSGVYKGFASKRAPGFNEADVQSTLKNSMTEAIRQVIADKQLISLLASY